MPRFLLDTNICVFLLRGKFDINTKINSVGWENCCISEITIAELKYGAEWSDNPVKNMKLVNRFVDKIHVIPIINSLDVYAKEKVRLRKKGILIDEFDLLIGSTAIACNAILVTDNLKHFKRIITIKTENWIDR